MRASRALRGRSVQILSVALSLTIHAEALELMGGWGASRTGPPVLNLASGENGTEVSIASWREATAVPEPQGRAPYLPLPPAVPLAPDPLPLSMPEPASAASPGTSPPPLDPPLAEPASLDAFSIRVPPLRSGEEDPPIPGRPGARAAASPDAQIKLEYPSSCRRLGHEGTVLIECEIDEQGKARSIRVAQSAGCEELDRAALEAVRTVTWKPGYKDGAPASSKVVQPVVFVLRAR